MRLVTAIPAASVPTSGRADTASVASGLAGGEATPDRPVHEATTLGSFALPGAVAIALRP
jgi:hypothetical protein